MFRFREVERRFDGSKVDGNLNSINNNKSQQQKVQILSDSNPNGRGFKDNIVENKLKDIEEELTPRIAVKRGF